VWAVTTYLVAGSPDWGDWTAIRAVARTFLPGDRVVLGNMRGAEVMMHRVLTEFRDTRRRDVTVVLHPIDWVKHEPADGGKNPAGHLRNATVLGFKPRAMVYFAHEPDRIPLLADLLDRCLAAGVLAYEWNDFVTAQTRGDERGA